LPNADGKSFLHLLTHGDGRGDWQDLAFSEYCSDEYAPVGGCYQRMVRLGPWKLVYYHGQEPQLFNLAEDPGELVDRAQDPACQAVRRDLIEMIQDGWRPVVIANRMVAMQADTEILRQWARHAQPADQFRWHLEPAMNYLKDEV
jgi:choline-sulfatase